MASAAVWAKIRASAKSASCGVRGVRWYIAKVPSRAPSLARIGVDQQAARPARSASSRKSSQNGSVAMSVTITGRRRWAAVPQEPTPSPVAMPSMASL
ncbi:hypothetical protein STENM223S_04871 [Streptomyces tendae]